MTSGTRPGVLNLYRRIFRSVLHDWEDPKHVVYIREEARREFKKNRDIVDEGIIRKLVKNGEDRVAIALHYQIPYEKPVHKVAFPS